MTHEEDHHVPPTTHTEHTTIHLFLEEKVLRLSHEPTNRTASPATDSKHVSPTTSFSFHQNEITSVLLLTLTNIQLQNRLTFTHKHNQKSDALLTFCDKKHAVNTLTHLLCDWLRTWIHNEQPIQWWGWPGSTQRRAPTLCLEACWSSALSTWNDSVHVRTQTSVWRSKRI